MDMNSETRTIDSPEILDQICRVAADRFAADAVMYRQLAEIPSAPMGYAGPVGPEAARLADELEARAKAAARFAGLFAMARPLTLEIPASAARH